MKLPDWLDAWAAMSRLVSTPSVQKLASMTPLTIPLLMAQVQTELIPRGFASSADPAVCYYVWGAAGTRNLSFTIQCTCGLQKRIRPDSEGRLLYQHLVPACGWRVQIELEGFKQITETKEERFERRKQEAEERSNKLSGL